MAAKTAKDAGTVMTAPADEKKTAVMQYDAADLGAGFEGTTADDFVLPFVRPLQKMSPECDQDKGEYIDGARSGTFLNTATKELTPGDTGFAFVPVHRTHQFLEFVPRDQGGGFVARFEPDDAKVVEAINKIGGRALGKIPFGDDNELVETFNVYGLQIGPDGEARAIVIPFSSTQIGTYKEMMTKLDLLRVTVPGVGRKQLPMFASRMRVTTAFRENKKGSWHLMQIGFDGPDAESARLPQDSQLYQEAKAFRSQIMSGKAKVEEGHGSVGAEATGEVSANNAKAF